MLERGDELAHALGSGGADIVLSDHVQHAGAHEAGDVAAGRQRQGDHRKHVGRSAGEAGGRYQFQFHGEQNHKRGGDHKARNRDSHRGKHPDHIVLPLLPAQRRETAKRYADHRSHHHRNGADLGGDRERLLDNIHNRLILGLHIADAEIAVQQVFQIIRVLDH